jgi:lysine 2,3-aminomutase
MEYDISQFNCESLAAEAEGLLRAANDCPNIEVARDRLRERVSQIFFGALRERPELSSTQLIRVRDCWRTMNTALTARSDARVGFSVSRALWDIARGRVRDDLEPGFCAELIHWIQGLEGRATIEYAGGWRLGDGLQGRRAAVARSDELDRLWRLAEEQMLRFADGLSEDGQLRRDERRAAVLKQLGGDESDWQDWHWHLRHIATDSRSLEALVPLTDDERAAIDSANRSRLPFGVTPYYASLMDADGQGRDRAIRAQVIPPQDYVDRMIEHRQNDDRSCDFMLESDTSPVDLVTRRYPAIAILKPFNTCPQICVYCQRNWEIEQVMASGALAREQDIREAISWIADHSAIQEVLITGGDPLALADSRLERIIAEVAEIPHVDLVRIGTRTPVTVPMRITEDLAGMLGQFRELGRREIVVTTHIEHPYEITLDTASAVDRLRRAGVAVYNQHVYTYFVSRRFENAKLRMLLRRIGVDPYYTFAPKGKEETVSYRVPLARLLQEQKEEARLIPGTRRTDATVLNVPGLGKNYLRAVQHRDLLSVLPDGSRIYEFHPWEKNMTEQDIFLMTDVPILDYLRRLADSGEDPSAYESIWYFF